MNLSKTALRELSAKYRAVLIKCALMNMMIFAGAGEHLKRLGMEIGAKAAVRLTNEVDLSVSYDGAFKKDYRDHTGMLNLKLMFQ